MSIINEVAKPKDTTSSELIQCYSDSLWEKEVEDLFPSFENGCINFGYWKAVPKNISLKQRLRSQIDLYNKVLLILPKITSPFVVEVGCGRGHGIALMHSKGVSAYGIDKVAGQVQTCKKNYPKIKNYFLQGSAENLPFSESSADVVVSIEAAQHFANFNLFLEESNRVLKSGGRLIISTFFLTRRSNRQLLKKIIPEKVEGFHNALAVPDVIDLFYANGYKNVQYKSIGDKVFEGFSKWAAQCVHKAPHTPFWYEAFDKGFIDYGIFSGEC